MKTLTALIKIEIRLAFRQRVVLFFNYLMPLVFFLVFAQTNKAEQGGAITQVVTMVTVIGILGNGLFGGGMRAVQEREANILRRYKVAPITPLPLLIASMVTGLVIYMPYVVFMLLVAKLRYGMVMPPHLASLLLFVMLGVMAVRSIGLIVASVVNSMQESSVLVQVLYMVMLFLSGATLPTSMFPLWLLTATQFIPSTWLVTGLQGILIRQETLASNWQAVGALLLTTVVGLLLCVKLFRWEKEEKMRPSAKLWVVAVLLPFVLLGSWQVSSKDNVKKTMLLDRQLSRSRTALIRDARIFVGDGSVIESGAVLVKNGRIEAVYDHDIPDPKSVSAQLIEAAGKTVLPGLVDVQIQLGAPGGFPEASKKYDPVLASQRELAAYLYCGVTAVRSFGDRPDAAQVIQERVNSGEKLGADLMLARGAAPPEIPSSFRERIADEDFAAMVHSGTTYTPLLSAVEAIPHVAAGTLEFLNRSLVLQVAPPGMMANTKKKLDAPESAKFREKAKADAVDMAIAKDNLLRAWKAGVKLVTGSDAGSLLVFHGPTVQHEMQLWVEAGIPEAAALQAATLNSAKALRKDQRFGSIAKGKEATLLVVDGNPLLDIRATEAISLVMLKGERINRSELLNQE